MNQFAFFIFKKPAGDKDVLLSSYALQNATERIRNQWQKTGRARSNKNGKAEPYVKVAWWRCETWREEGAAAGQRRQTGNTNDMTSGSLAAENIIEAKFSCSVSSTETLKEEESVCACVRQNVMMETNYKRWRGCHWVMPLKVIRTVTISWSKKIFACWKSWYFQVPQIICILSILYVTVNHTVCIT